jgi:hypothetical protein
MRATALIFCTLSVAGCAADGNELFAGEHASDEAVGTAHYELINTECSSGTIDVLEGQGRKTILTSQIIVASGQPRFIEAKMVGQRIAGKPDILQALKLECIRYKYSDSEPPQITERISTTQNVLEGRPPLTTYAHLALNSPGAYTCKAQASTAHTGARLRIYRDQTCITASDMAVTDWPLTSADEATIGEGRRVNKGVPQYVMTKTFSFPTSATTAEFRADIELTNIVGNKSGTADYPPGTYDPETGETWPANPIVYCEQTPYNPALNAYPRIRVEAEQVASSGTCGGYVWGQENDFTISPLTHHQKGYAKLARPISKASNCLPRFRVRVYIHPRSGGNDLCFHAARYSNIFAISTAGGTNQ